MDKKYWLINVQFDSKVGYSMVVHCGAQTIEDAISMAADAKLFNEDADANIATGEEADEDTIKHFKEWKLIQEL